MDTQRFQDSDRVQIFFLTLTGEARLWYESLRLINADWDRTKTHLSSNIQRQAILGNNYFMHGYLSNLMKIQKQ